ncbi:MAG: hypothetical protein ACYC1U_09920, partial [Candidatus Aquicultorales bacterium]
GLEACPKCGTEIEERIFPTFKEIGAFVVRIFQATDKRVRYAVVAFLLLATTLITYQAYPAYGTVQALVVWNDDVSDYPVVGARVLIYRNGKIQAERTTDDEGRLSLELPTGEIEVVVSDLHSVKTGREDYRITDRFWVARFWKKSLTVPRNKTVSLNLNPKNVDSPDISYFSAPQLLDYKNRTGWDSKGPFTQKQVDEALALVGK